MNSPSRHYGFVQVSGGGVAVAIAVVALFGAGPTLAQSSIAIKGITASSNELRLPWVCPAGFTNRLDVFACDEWPPVQWHLAASRVPTSGTNTFTWTDTAFRLHEKLDGLHVYALGNADHDRDGDGLPDAHELFLHRTTPSNPDSDGDGWSDSEELAENTNPLDRFSATLLARGVVIDEVLYDPAGPDEGLEWIEFYSSAHVPVDIGGFIVQIGDANFQTIYEFPPNTWIFPGHFLLLGGDRVGNRDLTAKLFMPNRSAEGPTAAVRLAVETSNGLAIADCLMYGGDETHFNENGLDATGWTSSSALSPTEGEALYRRHTGHDSDQVSDWMHAEHAPPPRASSANPDSDGDGLSDEEELTGNRNPFGAPTDRLRPDSDGDGLNDYAECVGHATNPNSWASDGDVYPWPPPSGLVADWPGTDPYEIAHGWNPLVPDQNANGVPDSWEMAFANLSADADGDGISNRNELLQNSNPNDAASFSARPFVLRFESSSGVWTNNGLQNVEIDGWLNVHFERLTTNVSVGLSISENANSNPFLVEWSNAASAGDPVWIDPNNVFASASLEAGSRPHLRIQNLGPPPGFIDEPVGNYSVSLVSSARLDAHEAWRGNDGTRVPDAEKTSPGLLVTSNLDGGADDPREAKLVFKALPIRAGCTRHVRCTPPGKVEWRLPDESAPAWPLASAEVEIPGPINQDFVRDVAMVSPGTWSASTSVILEYVVKDMHGREIASDRVRLIRPVVMAMGDSMTFGFMRTSNGTRLTPPTGSYYGWSSAAYWSTYPDDSQWAALSSPWNVPAHKSDAAYQGFRGVLAAALPGFLWSGENVLGHGPSHMGYNGATISQIQSRSPAGVLGASPCYAIVVYFAGLNDVVGGSSAASMYGNWAAGVQSILNLRQGKGKTLVVGVTLPKMGTYYSGYSGSKQTQLVSLNGSIRSYSVSAAHARYRVADVENIPHDAGGGLKDDGLHYLSTGYAGIGNAVAAAVKNGLR